MIPNFESNGNLPPGLNATSVEEFKICYVLNFSGSSTRNKIFDGYMKYCGEMIRFEVATKQWLNGSFTSNKDNPNDIDLVTHIDATKIDQFNDEQQNNLLKLADKKRIRSEYMCDVYYIQIYSPEIPELYEFTVSWIEYWLKWFGHDRNNNPKGIIEIDLPENSSYIGNYDRAI